MKYTSLAAKFDDDLDHRPTGNIYLLHFSKQCLYFIYCQLKFYTEWVHTKTIISKGLEAIWPESLTGCEYIIVQISSKRLVSDIDY